VPLFTCTNPTCATEVFWHSGALQIGLLLLLLLLRINLYLQLRSWSHLPYPVIAVMLLKTEWSLLLHTPQQRLSIISNWPDSPPPKLPYPMGESRPPSNTWFLEPKQVNPQIDRSVQTFLHSTSVWLTYRQTDIQTTLHVTSVTTSIYAMHAMRPCNI